MRLRRTLAATLTLVAGIVLTVQLTRGEPEPSNVAASASVRSPVQQAEGVASDLPSDHTVPAVAGTDGADAASSAPAPSGSPAPSTAASVVPAGTGHITILEPPKVATPRTTGRLVRVAIGAEGGLGIDSADFARHVVATLTDPRSWQAIDGVRFTFVTPAEQARGNIDFTVVLASPTLTDRLCAPLTTQGQVSCFWAGRAVINARRWQLAVPWFNGDLEGYREYVLNHEVGHGLGHGHATCPGKGKRSPVMAQQSLRLDGCLPWSWPRGGGT